MNFKLVGEIVVAFLCTLVLQLSNGQKGSNCLETHPRALHALFNYYNKDVDPWEVTENEVLGAVATFLGYKSILTSWAFEYWNDELTSLCAETSKCPASWKTLERIFLGFSILILIFSIISLGMGHCINIFASQVVYWDSVLQFLAGLFLLISGELVLDTGIKLDNFFVNTVFSNVTDFDIEEFREEMNYEGKIATGAIGIVNGVLYIIAAGIIASKWKPPPRLVEANILDELDIDEIRKSESSSENSTI